LTEGGARIYAICVKCDRLEGRSLRGPWLNVVVWVMGPLLALAAAVLLLAWITGTSR